LSIQKSKKMTGKIALKQYRHDSIIRFIELGLNQEVIAKGLKITQGLVSQVLSKFKAQGEIGIKIKTFKGASPKLTESQIAQIPELLDKGAEHYGLLGSFWTLKRIGLIIKHEFNVEYSHRHVSRLLAKLEYTLQRPKRTDYRQDAAQVAKWYAELPELKKKAHSEGRKVVYIDESGFKLLPSLVRTYAPKGETPVLYDACNYSQLSVCSAVREDGKFFWDIRQDSYNGAGIVNFLEKVLKKVRGKLLIIWDNATIHRSKEVKEFLKTSKGQRIWLEAQPAYSPEVNADEQVWNWLKNVELKNTCCKTLDELKIKVNSGCEKLAKMPKLICQFFKHPDVKFN